MSESCLESKETGPGLQVVSFSLILYQQELGCSDLVVFTATFGSLSFFLSMSYPNGLPQDPPDESNFSW